MLSQVRQLNRESPTLRKILFGNILKMIITLINELRTDHGTNRTSAAAVVTLVTELKTDHATNKTAIDEAKTLIDEMHDDHATFKTAVDNLKTVLGDISLSPAGLAIGVGSKKLVLIANTVVYVIDGVFKSKSTAEIAFTASTHDIADGSTAFFVLSIDASGTVTITKGADDAALSTITVPAGEAVLGVLELAVSGAIFDATSDDLDAGHLTDTYTDYSHLPQQIGAAPDTLSISKPSAGAGTIGSGTPAAVAATITSVAVDDITGRVGEK